MNLTIERNEKNVRKRPQKHDKAKILREIIDIYLFSLIY